MTLDEIQAAQCYERRTSWPNIPSIFCFKI